LPKNLVIVESPAKARTIAQYLGGDFVVESSVGHIRDIPSKANEVPEKQRDTWKETRFGVDIDNDFTAMYIVTPDSKQQVSKLRKELKGADALYLATDEDREGEAIAWHLLEVLKPKVPVHRMVFHEITEEAIHEAVENPRDLDLELVEAQETRRILDRLYGFEVSPVLWKKVQRGLSAGRVQSPTTRIIVDRERERIAFVAASYGGITGTFSAEEDGPSTFDAGLVSVDDERVATGKDFGPDGQPRDDRLVLSADDATTLAAELSDAEFGVTAVERKPYTRKPYAPFRTATLQQEAGRKLRFGTRRTMSAAQRLYESGHITYMRTDSTHMSPAAIAAARRLVSNRYGDQYLPDKPRAYGKAKGAQEAHEAIRPAGEEFEDPKLIVGVFGPKSDEAKVYDMIWKRTVASQMKDAKGESLRIELDGTATESGRQTSFSATGRTILFPGFLKAYVEDIDDPSTAKDDQESPLPDVREGQPLTAVAMNPTSHETKPPPRYTEASLVKRLEELGIGRPSTYASIISTIQDRDYIRKQGTALVPTLRAFTVVGLLEDYFGEYVDYEFTARMEEDLDRIAKGEEQKVPYLERFYYGNGYPGLVDLVSDQALDAIDPRKVNAFPIGLDDAGEEVVARLGQYGPYLVRGDERASVPDELPLDELSVAAAVEMLEAPSGDRTLGEDAESGLPVYAKAGRYGPYVQAGDRDTEAKTKPRTASLFSSMELETVTLDQALLLLSQPRTVADHPEDDKPITAQNGRYGPYIKWGSETRSLESEDQIFTIDAEAALALLAQPKKGRRTVAPLRELGEDPNSGKPIVVKSGRYGPYVTDGETNASLRTADTIEEISLDRAVELLAERRAKGPAKKKTKKKKK
jgi:DNA topoisomerase-1